MKKIILIILAAIFTYSCNTKNRNNDKTDESISTFSEEAYPDGTYCAEVEYYNPNTGTRNTYTLNVDVENNELTVINWPNCGWLDDSHFYPEELDTDGSCSFTSDKGYEYTIKITGPECNYTDNVQSDHNNNEDVDADNSYPTDDSSYDESSESEDE